ncbi:MAG: AarF/ABC1/UbiB kinase family protein [Elusimicrobia bacterium]|nr:AarF/ABC1/UbiB kinase family protein [Elusimicrobiota bacterium]
MGGLEFVGRTYRHLNRYREVAGVLAKHGFGDLLHVVRLDRAVDLGLGHRLKSRPVHEARERPERVRRVLEELGPTFVKAGQYLSTRADLLPEEYLRELAKLQDAVPPFPAEEAKRIVAEELGAPLERLFKSFTGRPLAAASIAQVHEATTADGDRVVVKVERPDIRARVAVDLEIMAHLAALAEHHLEPWRWRRPTRVVAEIARSLDRELDLSQEASHAERFARQFEGDPTVRVPRVRRDLSTARVLTLERLDGIKADDKAALERAGVDPREVAERLGRHYLAMILVHGFFHADPHPGNLLAMPDGAVGYLDFGMAGRLDRGTREALADALAAVAVRDEAAAARALLALAERDEEPDRRAFEADIGELMDQYAYRPLAEWRLGRMLEQFFVTTARHRVRVPPDLFLMVKAVTELECLARALDPRFDAVAAAAPIVRWVQEERLRPKRLAESLAAAGRETLSLLASAPGDLRDILRQARRGRLVIEFEHKGLGPALAELDQVGSRLAFAILLAALVVGSSLLMRAQVPPYWNGVSLLGLAGYCVSGLMSVWLLAAILRHGRL